MRIICSYVALLAAVIFHYLGIIYAGAKDGFLAGIDWFEELKRKSQE
jgi:hypothetical protein